MATRDRIFDEAWDLRFEDPGAARELLRPLCDADDANAWCLVGDTYPFSVGIPAERQAMVDSYERAYQLGSGRAALQLGMLAHCAIRTNEADTYFREAHSRLLADAQAGSAAAMHLLGFMYSVGFGVEPDEQRRLEWLTRAAEAGSGASAHELYYHFRALGSPEARKYYLQLKPYGVPHDDRYEDNGATGSPPN